MAGELALALCRVMKAVGYIQQTGRNREQNYSYLSDQDVLEKVQPAMEEHGLVLLPIKIRDRATERPRPNKGSMWAVHLVVTYKLMHVSGESVELEMAGEGVDTLDKATYKALTGCHKYLLRQLFLIPSGEDAEAEPAPERREAQPQEVSEPPEQEHAKITGDDAVWWKAKLEEASLSEEDASDYAAFLGRADPCTGSRREREHFFSSFHGNQEKIDQWIAQWGDIDAALAVVDPPASAKWDTSDSASLRGWRRNLLSAWTFAGRPKKPVHEMDHKERGKILDVIRTDDGINKFKRYVEKTQ